MDKITLGMPVYDDFHGAYFTIQAALMYHPVVDDIVVIDNNPKSPHGEALKVVCASLAPKGVRYFPMVGATGTAIAKNQVFAVAKNDVVVCCDAHVLFPPGVLAAIRDYFSEYPGSLDLIQGPLLYDDQVNISTHFNLDIWSGEMWGQWATNREAFDRGKPFAIPGQGMGAFACRKSAWLGFNSSFRGFGGEEGYIHEKFRKAGRSVFCLPQFLWLHRFGRPEGVPYPLARMDKVRNYCLGFAELGMSLTPIYDHFVLGKGLPNGQGLVSEAEWAYLAKGEYPVAAAPVAQPACAPCRGAAVEKRSLVDWYEKAKNEPSDFNEHVPTLKDLATGCDTVVEFGTRTGVSTAALLAAKPNKVLSYDLNDSAQARSMLESAKEEGQAFEFVRGNSLDVTIPECDLLFIDSLHTASHVYGELSKHAKSVKKNIVFHDTEAPWGEHGEDGGPGVLPAVRRFLAENLTEWFLKKHYSNNHGLTVISRDKNERVELPGKVRQAMNFAKAQLKHKLNGGKYLPLALANERLDECLTCEYRAAERCGRCSCYLKQIPVDSAVMAGQPGKVFYPTEGCPIGKWHPRPADGVDMSEAEIESMMEAA